LRALSRGDVARFAGAGVVVALHWVTFYASIKLANASVAATCMALTPVVIALIEPLIVRRGFDLRELAFGLAVVPGVVLVVGGTPEAMRSGILVGVASAVYIAIVSCLNKRLVWRAPALAVTGIEMLAGIVFLPLLGLFLPVGESVFSWPDRHDVLLLVTLAFACTLLPFALSLVALRELSAFSSALAVNMEPVYAIGLAMLFFHEQRELGSSFYAGVVIVLGVVFSHPLTKRPELGTSAGNAV
ncbi:MAG TPA: EamA family transporter, partial [Polyangiaceae bacterium]|nr:EamA family transporter [Polyangiaceae bacterium]